MFTRRILMMLNILAMRYSYKQLFIVWVLTAIPLYLTTWLGSIIAAGLIHLGATITLIIKIHINRMTGGR